MKEKLGKSYDWVIKYFMFFICVAMVGWIYEVLVIMFENHHGFQNRGVLYGPYLPVYGFGMLILMVTVNPVRNMKLEKILQNNFLRCDLTCTFRNCKKI